MACDRDHSHLIVFVHVCVATIRGRLLFLSQSSMRVYYLRAATNWGVASIRLKTVLAVKQLLFRLVIL